MPFGINGRLIGNIWFPQELIARISIFSLQINYTRVCLKNAYRYRTERHFSDTPDRPNGTANPEKAVSTFHVSGSHATSKTLTSFY